MAISMEQARKCECGHDAFRDHDEDACWIQTCPCRKSTSDIMRANGYAYHRQTGWWPA